MMRTHGDFHVEEHDELHLAFQQVFSLHAEIDGNAAILMVV
jgi:hypothetical protein